MVANLSQSDYDNPSLILEFQDKKTLSDDGVWSGGLSDSLGESDRLCPM